eukprot:7157603-Prymnesium_polylepis.2
MEAATLSARQAAAPRERLATEARPRDTSSQRQHSACTCARSCVQRQDRLFGRCGWRPRYKPHHGRHRWRGARRLGVVSDHSSANR